MISWSLAGHFTNYVLSRESRGNWINSIFRLETYTYCLLCGWQSLFDYIILFPVHSLLHIGYWLKLPFQIESWRRWIWVANVYYMHGEQHSWRVPTRLLFSYGKGNDIRQVYMPWYKWDKRCLIIMIMEVYFLMDIRENLMKPTI